MTNQQAGLLGARTQETSLAQEESLLEVVRMLELAGHLVDRALGDDAGPALSPEDGMRLVRVRLKIQYAVSLVRKQLT